MCANFKCNCHKQKTLTARHFELKSEWFESKLQKILKGTQITWYKFLKPAVNISDRFFGVAVGPQTKNPQVSQCTTKILKSVSGGKLMSPTDMHCNGLVLKVK